MAKLGIQTIIFGGRTREDFAGVLADIKRAGYDGAEIGVQEGSRTPEEVKALFDAAGLVPCGYHSGYNGFTDTERLPRIGEHMAALGVKYLMCSGTASRERDGYLSSADVFNKAGEILAPFGVHFCYHNHAWEFHPLKEGGNGMTLLLSNTDPAKVKLCTDVYWVACGGENPAQFIRDNAERCVYFHFKDGTYDTVKQERLTFTELGRGTVNFAELMPAVRECAPEWIATEQDKTDGDPFESAKISADYARTLGI